MKAISSIVKRFSRLLVPVKVRQLLRSLLFQAKRPYILRKALRIGSRLTNQHPDRKTILFFAPEAGVTPYLMVQAIIGKTLQEKKHNVIFVRCFNMLRRCPVKEMVRLSYDASPKQTLDVCLNCWRSSEDILSKYKLDYIDLRELIDGATKQKIALSIKNLPDDRLAYCYENIRVGNLAFYDFAIANKHPATEPMSPQEYFIFDQYLETVIMSIEMTTALASHHKIDTLANFDEYGMMSAVRLCAKVHNISPRMVSIAYHLNGDWRHVMGLSNLSIVKEQAWRLAQWANWRDLALTEGMVKQVIDDLIYRFTNFGTHIYSPNKTLETDILFKQLGLKHGRKTLVAFTSSTDEHDALLYGIKGLRYSDFPSRGAFSDTFEWLHSIIEYVEKSDDLQLVIRLHPRIGATLRDGIPSKDYQRYRNEFSGAYEHTKLMWPEEKISSYDLAEFADVALITWSSMGLELARLGVPVLSGYPSIFTLAPNEGFIVTALDKNTYYESLRELLSDKSSNLLSHMIRLSFRWYQMSHFGNTIDMSDVIRDRVISRLPKFALSKNADIVEEVFINDKDAFDFNLTHLQELQVEYSIAAESAALAAQIGRLIIFMCTGIDGEEYQTLTIVDRMVPERLAYNELMICGCFVEYRDAEKHYSKYSPLVARLGMAYFNLRESVV
jgi:hypothetical protein